jgi:hypothetical protein
MPSAPIEQLQNFSLALTSGGASEPGQILGVARTRHQMDFPWHSRAFMGIGLT